MRELWSAMKRYSFNSKMDKQTVQKRSNAKINYDEIERSRLVSQ